MLYIPPLITSFFQTYSVDVRFPGSIRHDPATIGGETKIHQ